MQTEGFRKSTRRLTILAALVLDQLLVTAPACAQHILTILPHQNAGDENPISFMRPHYQIHLAAPDGAAGPPSSAFSPAQVRHAYGFDRIINQGAGQIIGTVDAYDDPRAEADLAVFNAQFGLPACTSSNNCFRKVYSNGRQPATNANWAMEIALDIE